MSRARKNCPTRYFHGTRTNLTPGTILRPGIELGKINWWEDRSGQVYVTTDPSLARAYAEEAKGRGKPRILEVAPDPATLTRDDISRFEGRPNDTQYSTASAVVLNVLWTSDNTLRRKQVREWDAHIGRWVGPLLTSMNYLIENIPATNGAH